MGYSTDFAGAFTIAPPLSAEQVEEINAFVEARHDGHPIGIWCDWYVSAEGRSIEWNMSEKSYNMDEWIKYLIDQYIEPAGSVLNGTVEAQGEEADDRWNLIVKDNKVMVQDFELRPMEPMELT